MKKRSKSYKKVKEKIENKTYSLSEAIKLIKETARAKFDESIEVHIKLGIDLSKSEQQVRGTVVLPHSIGKKLTIAAFVTDDKKKEAEEAGAEIVGGEDLIKKIKETKKCDFNIAVAMPELMPKLGQIGKILGPKGLMPNPKAGTITSDPVKTIKEILSGKISFRTDSTGVIHQVIGKVSFDDKKIAENFNSLLEAVKTAKPSGAKGEYIKSITLSSTMGPGIRVKS